MSHTIALEPPAVSGWKTPVPGEPPTKVNNSVSNLDMSGVRRGKQSASLDNAVTWNYPPSQPQVCPFVAKHKRYDHGVLSFAFPCEDFITSFKVPKRSFDIPTDRVDVVFFQRNLLQWHKNVQQRISPFSSQGGEATGESLLQKMRGE